MSDRIPFRVKPMLATLVADPFDKSGWVYEEKYDGVRLLAYKEGKRVQLLTQTPSIDSMECRGGWHSIPDVAY